MKLNQIGTAVALTLLAGTANATAFTVSPDPMTSGSVYIQGVYHTPGVFEDTFSFKIDSLVYGGLDTVWASFSEDISNPQGGYSTQISNLAISLWHDLATDVQINSGSMGAMKLVGGDYYFKVAGASTGVMGGNYLFAMATTVPEPQTLALLGLGLLGLGISRRR